MRLQLKDKVAIVTGASRGIGRAMTESFVDAGARVMMVSRKLLGLEQVAAEFPDGVVDVFAADAGSPEAPVRASRRRRDASGGSTFSSTCGDQPLLRRRDGYRDVAIRQDDRSEPAWVARVDPVCLPSGARGRPQHFQYRCFPYREEPCRVQHEQGRPGSSHTAARLRTRSRCAGGRDRARPCGDHDGEVADRPSTCGRRSCR